MRPEPHDTARLWDMLTHAQEIQQTAGAVPFEHYVRDKTLRMATERRLEIIGEAARNVSRPFQAAHAEIPWQKIVAMRHILAHEYGELKQETVHRIAAQHIPALVAQLIPLVPPAPIQAPEGPSPGQGSEGHGER